MHRNLAVYGNCQDIDKRLNDYLDAHSSDDVTVLLQGLKKDINAFVGPVRQFDDITMLVLEYKKAKEGDKMIEKTFNASLEKLNDVLAFVDSELIKAECSMKVNMQIAVAVEEIFVNIAQYAYPGEEGKMKLGVAVENGKAVIRFTDYGIPFDPLQKPDPDTTLDADQRRIGGLGIFMVKKSMDDVSYVRKDNQNILTLTRNID